MLLADCRPRRTLTGGDAVKTVNGKFDGRHPTLDEDVHVEGEVPVLVTFPELPDEQDWEEFLGSGPVRDDEEIAVLEEAIRYTRRWRS